MTFLAPTRLWLLLAVGVLAAAYLLVQRRRTAYAVRFTNLALLDQVAPRRPGWRRHVPAAAFLGMLLLLVIGFARPTAEVEVPRERATVVVVVDTSTSMQATDVAPSRLAAAQEAAGRFADLLPDRFNVGLVAFSGSARQISAPTLDRASIQRGLDGLQLGPGTAIGEGVFAALDAVRSFDAQAAEDPPPARIVLLSDGENTTGRPPEQAAVAAAEAGVPVSTIAYGTPAGAIVVNGQRVPVPVDAPALQELAEATGGSFHAAATGEELQDVYADIGSSVGYESEPQEITGWFVGFGLLLAMLAAAGSLRWFARLP